MARTGLYRNISIGLLILYIMPLLILGQDSFWDAHDSMDYYIAMLTAADKSGDLWNLDPNSLVEPILGGIPRFCFHNNFDFHVVLFTLFSPFTATLLNFIFVHFIGWIGMYLLLKDHLLTDRKDSALIPGSALFFSVLPLYPMLGISFSGTPLLLWSILNLINKQPSRPVQYAIIGLFVFYSSFVYIGMFVLIVLGITWLYGTIKKKKWSAELFKILLFTGILYIIFNYHLFYQFLIARDFRSNREESKAWSYNIKISLWAAWDMFVNGHYHAHSFHTLTLVFILPIALVIAWLRRSKHQLLHLLVILAICFSGFYGFWQWDALAGIKQSLKILTVFRWDRFYFFNPILWSLILILSLYIISQRSSENFKWGRLIAGILLIVQTIYILHSDKTWMQNFVGITERIVALPDPLRSTLLGSDGEYHYKRKDQSYRGFYQEELFNEIDRSIGQPKDLYRVVSLGFNPTIAQYNGFYTSDGYLTSYPLEYKHKFRRVMEQELAKNKDMREYFDYWGSRCYLYSAELWIGKKSIDSLRINTNALRELGSQYIFSSAPIRNATEIELDSVAYYHSRVNDFEIWLYRIQ